MAGKSGMTYEATSDYRYGQVTCDCGIRIRVMVSQYRVECHCGRSAILSELIREAQGDVEDEPKNEQNNGGPDVAKDIPNG
jgi:hypothetical protein